MATGLEDFELLSRISNGDLTALEAKYHLSCLTSLRNKYRVHVGYNKTNATDENIDALIEAAKIYGRYD